MSSHTDTAEAVTFCTQLVKTEARNFYYGFLLLPRPKRQAVYALYAFCRVLDDAVDDETAPAGAADAIRARFQRMIRDEGPWERDSDRMIAAALAAAAAEYPFTPRHLTWIVEGVLMDLTITRYETMSDLRKYLFGVASAVGLTCIEIFRYRRPAARAYAVYLGYAMQITNILRDVKEDFQRGRVYLPAEDLTRFGVKESDLGADHTSENVRRLLAFEGARARDYFRRAEKLWPVLAKDAAPCPFALARIYGALLTTMERNGFTVLERRFRLPAWRKLSLMLWSKLAFLL